MFSYRRYLPTRIDRYILGEVVGPFLGGTLLFLFIFMMFQALRLADFFIVKGAPGPVLLKLAALMALSFVPFVLPMAFLIGVLVAFGRLSSDSEFVAIKASGISAWRMAAPVLLVALALVGITIGLNMNWVPWGMRTSKSLQIKVGNTKVVSVIKEGTFTSGFFDLLIFADKVDTKTNRLTHVFIFDEREPKNPMTVVARAGEIVNVKTKSDLSSAVMLKLYNGSIHHSDIETNSYERTDFGEYRLFLKTDEGTGDAVTKPEMIPQKQLVRLISANPISTYAGREYRGEYWRRLAVAITPLIFAFLGIGFGSFRTRAVRAGAFLVGIGTILVYWLVQTMGTVAVQRGTLPAFVAMQLPNMVMLALAALGFSQAIW